MKKNILAFKLAFILMFNMVFTFLPYDLGNSSYEKVKAATFDDINQEGIFMKQQLNSVTCTLVASVMLLRRVAVMMGSDWTGITENSLKPHAWSTGQGLKHDFTYNGVTVSYDSFGSDKEGELINLLTEHPEGIVVFDSDRKPDAHAILVTDYTNGVFYCADPSADSRVPRGRIPISSATVKINESEEYWYVASPDVSLVGGPTAPSVTDAAVTDISSGGYTVTCNVSDDIGVTRVKFPTWTEKDGQDDLIWYEGVINGNTASMTINTSNHNNEAGTYITHIYVYDASGNYSSTGVSVDISTDRGESPTITVSPLPKKQKNDIGFIMQPSLDFYRVRQFSEGLAAVVKDGKWGYINEFGETVIDFKYEAAFEFKNGLAAVLIDDMFGYINKSGDLVIPAIYDIQYYNDDVPFTDDFSSGVAVVANVKGYGVIDGKGKIIVPLQYDYITPYSDDIARIKLDNKWGYIDKNGKFISEMKWSKCSYFSEGLASVADDSGKQFYIDKGGKVAIDVQEYIKEYSNARIVSANDFHEGYAVIKTNYMSNIMDFTGTNKQIVIDKSGNIIYESFWFNTYDRVVNGTLVVYQSTSYSLVGIVGKNLLFGLVDIEKSKFILEPEYTEISDFSEGFAFATYQDKVGRYQMGVIDTSGKAIVDYRRYELMDYIHPFSEGYAAFYIDGNIGYYDQTGKEAWSRTKGEDEYDSFKINDFHNGLAFVQINGLWGILSNSYSDYKEILDEREAPGTVSGLKIGKLSSTSVSIQWDKVSGAQSYQILRSAQKSGGYTAIAIIDKNTYTDKKVTSGKTYYYKVRAISSYNDYGKYSKALYVKIK